MKLGSASKSAPKVPTTSAKQAASAQSAAAQAAEPAAPEPEDKKAAKARAKQEKAEAKALAKAEKAEKKKSAKADRQKKSSGGGPNFFSAHVEKLALGLAVCLALGLMYLTFGKLEVTPAQSPQDLHDKVTDIENRVKSAPFADAAFPVPVYDDKVRHLQDRIGADQFVYANPWDPVLVPKQKRGQVEIYPVEKPLASAGAAAIFVRQLRNPAGPAGAPAAPVAAPAARAPAPMGMAPGAHPPGAPAVAAPQPGGGPSKPLPAGISFGGVAPPKSDPKNPVLIATEGRRWVVINALLPTAKESAEYARQLGNAFEYNPSRDQPLYGEVRMMRLEIPPGADEDHLDWSQAKVLEWQDQVREYGLERQTWSLTAPELVPPAYCRDDSSRLTSRLRAAGMGLLTKPLAPLVSRSWIPWAIHPVLREILVEEALALAEKQAADAAAEKEKKEEAPKDEPTVPAKAPEKAEPGADPFGDLGRKRVAPPPVQDAKPKPAKRAARAIFDPNRAVEFQLVRAFDFTVEAGKRYRYKLQLAASNPNDASLGLQPRNIMHPERSAEKWLYSPWSAPTNTVIVPSGDSIYAESVDKGPAELNEKIAKVVVTLLNFDKGQESAAEMSLRRGGLASGRVSLLTLDPLHNQVTRHDDQSVHTDLVLADMRGGDPISPGMTEPSQVLFIDAGGQLVMQDSAEDEMAVSLYRKIRVLFEAPTGNGPPNGGAPPADQAPPDLLFGGGQAPAPAPPGPAAPLGGN